MTRRPKADWSAIKAAYQAGEGSCRELAERFGASPSSVQKRCVREGWRVQKSEVVQKVNEEVQKLVQKKAVQIAEEVIDVAEKWKTDTVSRCWMFRRKVDETLGQLEPAADPNALDALARVESRMNDIMRKNLGLKDGQEVDLKHSGSINLNVFTPEVLEEMSKSWEEFERTKLRQEEAA